MSDLKIQGVVEMSAEGAERVLDRLGDKAVQMAGRTEKAAQKAGDAVDGIGAGANGSADQLTRAEGRMLASIKRVQTQFELAGKTASQKLEYKIDTQGLDAAKFEPALAKLRELEAAALHAGGVSSSSLNGMGMSAKATAAALRGVPAQFTDIITSLQGGQAPLTVFLQQGGQLQDMFGGAGNAAKALGGYVVGLATPLTVTAAAAAALGVAYYQGAAESEAFNKSLIMTGNIAGTTAGQLGDMAKTVAGSSGATIGAVAETLNNITASGKVSADMLGKVAQAAVDMERAGGAAAADTVKEFSSLGDAPVSALIKLNDKYHFLTASVYEQVKALQDQGRETDAAKLAQETYANAIESRVPALVQNIGYLETAWKGVWGAVKGYGDAALSIGRESTLSDQLAAVKKKIELASSGPVWGDIYNNSSQDSNPDLEKQKRVIEAMIAGEKSVAEQVAAQNKAREAGLAWAQESTKYTDQQEKKQAEILRVTTMMTDAGKSQAEIAKVLTQIEEKYAEKKSASAKAVKEDFTELFQRAEQMKTIYAALGIEFKEIEKQNDDYAKSIAALIDPIEKEASSLERQEETYGLTRSQIEQTTIARLEEAKAMAAMNGAGDDAIAYYEREIDARKRIAAASASIESRKATDDAAKHAADEWKKTADKIGDSITDALMRGFESGKTFAENLRDTVENMFKTLVLRPIIQATVTGGLSAVGLGSSSALASGTSSTSSLGSFSSLASGAKSAYDLFSNGAANTYNNMASSSLGQSLGLSTAQSAGYMAPVYDATGALISEGTGTAAGGLTSLGSSIGTSLAYAGAGLIGSAIGNAIAGDKRIIDGVSSSTIGAAVGALAGPLGAGIGGVVGGLFDAAFGMGDVEYTDKGIQGTFSGASFSGNSYQNWEQDGGWFRSDDSGTDTSPLDSATTSALSTSFTLLKLETGRLAAGLGVDTANIAAYSKAINLTLTDDADANTKAISDMIAGISEEMSAMVLAGTNFGLAGETSSETLSRLYNSLTTVNQAFASINMTAYETSLAGGDMASQLALLMGGIDAFKTSITSYYGTYFSAEEQQADLVKQTTASIQALGVAVPATKEQFRALIESLDVTTASGRATFAGLMSVSSAFATMTDAAEATAKAAADAAAATAKAAAEAHAALLQSAQDAIGSAVDADYSALERAVSAQKTALQTAYEAQDKINQSAITAATSVRDTLSSLADTLESAVGTIVADADSNLLSLRNAAQTVLDDAYTASQSGLSLDPYSESIKSAITALSKPSDQVYSTYEEYARAQGRANAAISALSVAAGDQLDVADLTLKAIKDAADEAERNYSLAIADLDKTLENAEEQINVLRGIDTRILSVKDAIDALAAALGAALGTKVTPTTSTVGKWTATNDGRYYQSSAGAVLTQAAGSSDVILHAANGESATVAQTVAAASAMTAEGLYAATKNAGLTLAELDAMMGWSAGRAEAWATQNKLPTFAVGTNYVPSDMTAQIHQGERIIPAADNRMLMSRLAANDSNSDLLAELKALREEVNLLRYEARATATNTGKAAKTLDKFDNDGLPAERVAA